MPFLKPGDYFGDQELGLEIVFNTEVLAHFDRYRQTSCWKREAGGQLFSVISEKQWQIVKATGPRLSDFRRRFQFFPDHIAEQSEINELFNSGLHYVGDWHTHPEARPKPSQLDLSSMTETVRNSIHQLPGFLMVISGTEDCPAGLWVSFHLAVGAHRQLLAFKRSD